MPISISITFMSVLLIESTISHIRLLQLICSNLTDQSVSIISHKKTMTAVSSHEYHLSVTLMRVLTASGYNDMWLP